MGLPRRAARRSPRLAGPRGRAALAPLIRRRIKGVGQRALVVINVAIHGASLLRFSSRRLRLSAEHPGATTSEESSASFYSHGCVLLSGSTPPLSRAK